MVLDELYQSIVDDVFRNAREAFVDEGVDEQTMLALKASWLTKIRASCNGGATSSGNSNNNTNNTNNITGGTTSAALTQPLPPTALASVITSSNNIPNTNNFNSASNHSIRQQQAPAQQPTNAPHPPQPAHVIQLDGSNATSDEDENDEELDEEYPDEDLGDSDEDEQETANSNVGDEDPLNSGDDISNDEGAEVFETENVVVCQYDKISRHRNKWKFHLKDGMMNLNGKDYVFQKAVGDAEW